MPAGGDLGVSIGTAADGGAEFGLDVLKIAGADIVCSLASTRVGYEVCRVKGRSNRLAIS